MKLDSYLRRRGETITAFIERAGISEATFFRVRKLGARSGKVMDKILAACGGAVTPNDLVIVGKRKRVA